MQDKTNELCDQVRGKALEDIASLASSLFSFAPSSTPTSRPYIAGSSRTYNSEASEPTTSIGTGTNTTFHTGQNSVESRYSVTSSALSRNTKIGIVVGTLIGSAACVSLIFSFNVYAEKMKRFRSAVRITKELHP